MRTPTPVHDDGDDFGYMEGDASMDLLAPPEDETSDEAWLERWEGSRKKLLLVASMPIALGPLIGAMYFPSIPDMQRNLHTSAQLGALTLSLYSLVSGIAPLIYGASSDQFGRKPSYILALGLFCGACFMASGVWDIYSLLAIRMVMAAGMAGFGVAATGMIADMFPAQGRGRALALSVLPALVAPIVGPVLGGALAEYASWRYCFFLMALASFPFVLLFAFVVPETRKPSRWRSMTNPFRPLAFVLHPPIGLTALCRSLLFAAMYTMVWSVPIIIEEQGGSSLEAGLLLLPYGVFTIVGSLMGGKATDKAAQRFGHGGTLMPFLVSVAAVVVGGLVYGWTIENFKAIAIVASCLVGWGLTFGRPGIYSFAIEEKPQEAGSVTSCLSTIKFLTITVEVTLAPWLLDNVGIGWLMTLYCGVLALSALPAALIMTRNMERKQQPAEDLYSFVG
eukprot:TRINITY_DN1984_c0_g2_i1.p1 TRINITY_DN1984_c0_g2~~TRINITY_DN1984_c0_g2_i1.p1  ORF type:complete len:451 (-),score=136.17 TRINITY_DN1984_c0_g2_i1:332-1684(-)